jgi:hypothetical protein
MGIEEAFTPGPNFNRPVKDLVSHDKDLLTSTFTQSSHDRGKVSGVMCSASVCDR